MQHKLNAVETRERRDNDEKREKLRLRLKL